jgi:rare lipoprotein A (peptidoglycan hydrolase)
VAWYIRVAAVVASVATMMLAGCSTVRLGDFDGPRYSSGPERPSGAQAMNSAEQPSSQAGREATPAGTTYGTPRPGGGGGYGERPVNGQAGAVASVPPQQPGRAQPSYRRQGGARWMGASWSGHVTTTQERFDPDRLTGAHASLPLPSYLYVTNRMNGRTVLIRINDRPSAAAGSDGGTVVVVSRRVADLLDFSRQGSANVDLQYAGPAGLMSTGQHEESFLRRQPWYSPGAGQVAQAASGSWSEAGDQRYPPPTYPRWDNTQRTR